MCCPSVAGPAKWPRRVPPENISLPEVGSSSEMRTSTFRVRPPQQSALLNISTLSTMTLVSKSMAIQGVASLLGRVEQIPPCGRVSTGTVLLSIQWSAPNAPYVPHRSTYVDDWVAEIGSSSRTSPENAIQDEYPKHLKN